LTLLNHSAETVLKYPGKIAGNTPNKAGFQIIKEAAIKSGTQDKYEAIIRFMTKLRAICALFRIS